MPKFRLHFVRLAAIYLLLAEMELMCECASVLDRNLIKSGELGAMAKSGCAGRIGDCAAEEEMMDSESNRRGLLMGRRYISYETLKRDLVPCDRPGASYYNCKGPGVANSYGRGCEIITRCARGD